MGYHTKLANSRKALNKFFRARFFHYSRAFLSESGQWVLEDMAKEANLHGGLFSDDQRRQDYALGYRAAVLRIARILKFTPTQIDNMTSQGSLDDE